MVPNWEELYSSLAFNTYEMYQHNLIRDKDGPQLRKILFNTWEMFQHSLIRGGVKKIGKI